MSHFDHGLSYELLSWDDGLLSCELLLWNEIWLDRGLLSRGHRLLDLCLDKRLRSLNNMLRSLDNGLLKHELLRLSHRLLCLNHLRCKHGLRHDNLWGGLLSLDLLNQNLRSRLLGSSISLWFVRGLGLVRNGFVTMGCVGCKSAHWAKPEKGGPANTAHVSRYHSHPFRFHILDSKRVDDLV